MLHRNSVDDVKRRDADSFDGPLIENRLLFYGGIFGFFTFTALMNFGILVTNSMAEGYPVRFQYPLINELTGSYSVLLLLPALLWFMKKYPLRRGNLATRIPLHVLVSIIFGVCHTMLMQLSREIIYDLAGMGDYDYGLMGFRLLMEYHKQFLSYWFTVAVVHLVNYVRKNQEQKLATARLQEQLTRARLQTLQMQLNPHFLFNTLNMISSTMYEDIKAADKMLAYLSDLLRITLNSTGQQECSLKKERRLLELYLEIMKARFKDKLKIQVDFPDETQPALVPGFILQPLVENSIKYGMENLEGTVITVSARKSADTLVLEILDNGPGIDEAPEKVISNGVGLSNTEERLEKLYGDAHTFQLENIAEGGLCVRMVIPFRQAHTAPYAHAPKSPGNEDTENTYDEVSQ
ncbi:MAG: hypothetical protein GY765_00350 [bacterium]|nr:hypothetical protein [bacterium]